MPAMGVYEQIKKAFQDVIAPEIHELHGEIRRLDQKIDGVDARLNIKLGSLDNRIDNMDQRLTIKIDGLRAEMVSELRRVDNSIAAVHTRIDGLDREVRTAIDIRERLAALEARRPAGS
jgi:uncharacterized protein Yka (UPF0111/DUF47 family)